MTSGPSDPHPRWDRCLTPDGLRIAVYDFGGHGEDALLVHATGFCAEVLGPLARGLQDRYHCWGVDLRAHGRSDRPPDGNFAWSGFCTDVLAAIDHLGLSRPFGFGHSCGGAAVLLAEEARPGTFTSLYCFEPVVFEEPPGGLVIDNPLSRSARRRRETFPSAEDAFLNFSSKPPFADIDPEVLGIYVESGFGVVPPDEGGEGTTLRLRCRRDDEAEIYAQGTSHGAFRRLGEITCPVTLCCGERSDAFGPAFMQADADQIRRSTVEIAPKIGHFGPLQEPSWVAGSVGRAWTTTHGTPRS